MNMPLVPDNIMEQLKFFCEANELGLSQLAIEGVQVLVLGTRALSPDQVSIVAAHLLLTGVITGDWNKSNEAALMREVEERKTGRTQ